MQNQRSVTADIHRLPVEHSDPGIIKPIPREIRIEDALRAANFIETVEHRDVSASNLFDRFVEIQMDQYVYNTEGERVWCEDIIESIHVMFLDKEGDEIARLQKHGTTFMRLTGYTHPYTGEKICVKRTWGDDVLSLFWHLGEEMFDVHSLHYVIREDRGGLREREIMYSSPQNEDNIIDYLLSIWKTPLPPGAMNIIRAAEWARGNKCMKWVHF